MSKYPTRLERFEEECRNTLPGDRHRNLLKLARLGRLAKIENGELIQLMHARLFDSDPTRLGEVEIAVEKVASEVPLGGDYPEGGGNLTAEERRRLLEKLPKRAPAPAQPKPDNASRGFFERMRDAGRRWYEDHPLYPTMSSAIYDLSPVRFNPTDWREQAALQIDLLAQDWLGFTFTGEQTSPRDGWHVQQAETLEDEIRSGRREIPPQIMANQLTGGRSWIKGKSPAGGHWSMATLAEILHYRHAVIEFDAAPLEEQAAFWLGCIAGDIFDLRTLVYSGSKSIHGIIRLKERRDLTPDELGRYAKLAGCPTDELTEAAVWTRQWKDLERLLCSSEDPAYHLDPACKDATRQTRLAGHLRTGGDVPRRQALLWLAPPDPRDLPDPFE